MKGNEGFSVLEILVAAGVVAVVVAASLPAVTAWIDAARERETRTEMREIAHAMRIYYERTGSVLEGLEILVEPDGPGWDGPYMFAGRNPEGFTPELLDEWGTPYALYRPSADLRVIRSLGTNRMDEGGAGDDLDLRVDFSRYFREDTVAELGEINDAILAYNAGGLPDDPLPPDIDQIVEILQDQGFLPDDEGYTTDAWGNSYGLGGEEPVDSVYAMGSMGASGEEGGEPGGDGDDDDDGGKVTICHIPPGNPENAHTIEVSSRALRAHLAHGDYVGECTGEEGDDEGEEEGGKVTLCHYPPGSTDTPYTIHVAPSVVQLHLNHGDYLGECAPVDGDGKVTICHVAAGDPPSLQTILVSPSAVPAHLAHGDSIGACPPEGE